MADEIKSADVTRIVIAVRQKRVFAFVQGRGRMLVAEGDAFKTDWTLKEIVAKLNG